MRHRLSGHGVSKWKTVRDARRAGPCAPHKIAPFPAIDVVSLVGEGGFAGGDYLTLNLWAPERAENKPVMVFIHGGGYVVGSKDAPVQDGTEFARSGIVCIAINYRLGIDGFLPIPGIPTNLGLRDMIAALQWVRDNVAEFGGDPANVTVFGESAGAMAIANLIASSLAGPHQAPAGWLPADLPRILPESTVAHGAPRSISMHRSGI